MQKNFMGFNMFNEDFLKNLLNVKKNEMIDKIEKEKVKLKRQLEEAPKYFIKSEDRTYVAKGWGYEDWIWNDEKYCGKKLFFKKGKKCSWHYHKIKDEVLYLDYGKLLVHFSEDDDLDNAPTVVLTPGDAFHVPPGLRHRMTGLLDSMIMEVSTQHFDEDSISVIKGDVI
jgi:mannose-6-phosphate isomerase-like protein (cupin superfamily)